MTLTAISLLATLSASAHDLRPGAVALAEVAPGRWAVHLSPAQDGSGVGAAMRPVWPPRCALDADGVLACAGPTPSRELLVLAGLSTARVKVRVTLRDRHGRRHEALLREGEDAVDLGDRLGADPRLPPSRAATLRALAPTALPAAGGLLTLAAIARRPGAAAWCAIALAMLAAALLGALTGAGTPAVRALATLQLGAVAATWAARPPRAAALLAACSGLAGAALRGAAAP